MTLTDVLARAFAGGRTPPGGAFGVLLDEARRLAGSGRAAARAIGVPESTFRRWSKGLKRPAAVAAARRRTEIGVRRLMQADARVTSVRVELAVPPRKGPSDREVRVDPRLWAAASDAWAAGDMTAMLRLARKAVADDWYRDVLFRPRHGDPGGPKDDDDLGDSEPAAGEVAW